MQIVRERSTLNGCSVTAKVKGSDCVVGYGLRLKVSGQVRGGQRSVNSPLRWVCRARHTGGRDREETRGIRWGRAIRVMGVRQKT